MAESIGTFDRLWISSDGNTYSSLEFLDGSGLQCTENFTNTKGFRGTRQERAERTRKVQEAVSGQIQMAPNASELDLLLPWILGGTKSGNSIPFAETVPDRYFRTSRDGTIHTYTGCKVQSATFQASEGSPLTVGVQLLGVSEAATGTAPAAAMNDATSPYILSDCALTVGGTTYQFRQISITIQNMLDVKFNNSLTATSIKAADFMVGVDLTLPYGDASALYGSGISGVAVIATFTNGGTSIAFEMPYVQTPKEGIPLGGRRSRDLTWRGVARKNGTDNLINVTNDSTP